MTPPPKTISRYQIRLPSLGEGGMATVYRAFDPHFQREVAIKVLPREMLHLGDFLTRFRREATTIAALEHPAIVPVHDFGESDGQPFLVMRLMSGGSLKDRLDKGPLSLEEIARLFTRLAPALDYAHRQGVIHRDLKPGNVLFDQHSEPYLADFGIARITSETNTLTHGAVIGTPAYISPEQGLGQKDITHRSDIYALGAMLFEMLTGRIPYEAATPTGQIMRHITEPVPDMLKIRPNLPKDCQSIVAQAMAKEPADRYSTVGAMAAALNVVADGKPLPKSLPTLKPIRPLVGGNPLPEKKTPPKGQTNVFARGGGLALVLVFLSVIGCVLLGFALRSWFATVAMSSITPTQTLTPTITHTLTPTLSPSTPTPLSPSSTPEILFGSATFLHVQGPMSVEVAGQSPLLAQVGLTLPVDAEIMLTSSGTAELELSDGTHVFLGENTTLTLMSVAISPDLETRIKIEVGTMLVGAIHLTVETNETALFAQVSDGWMGVTYQPDINQFLVECLSGECRIGDLVLNGGQRAEFANSVLGEPTDAQYETWVTLGGPDVHLSAPTLLATEITPTATLTVTPTRPVIPIASTPTPTKKPKDEKTEVPPEVTTEPTPFQP